MKKLITCLTAGLLVLGAQSLLAQTDTNSAPATPGAHQGATPEQREKRMGAILKILDLNPADLKAMDPKDRQAKIKETAEKFVADLKAKKATGTLTDEEQTNLDKIQKFLAHGHKKAAATTPAPSN
jgi:hypothetical protein